MLNAQLKASVGVHKRCALYPSVAGSKWEIFTQTAGSVNYRTIVWLFWRRRLLPPHTSLFFAVENLKKKENLPKFVLRAYRFM